MSDISDKVREDGKVILVADDNAQIRKLMEMICSSTGYEVHTVADGQAAFDFYVARRPGLIFTDQDMRPGMNGFELMEQIKQYGQTHEDGVPVVLVSGDPGLTKEAVVGRGFADFIAKPYRAGDIHQRINTFLPKYGKDN